MWRRLTGALIGLIYAVLYGFWTMLLTGGGHGNFLWFMLFFFGQFVGLFFPLMGFLVVDLRSKWAKVLFGGLLATSIFLTGYILANPGEAGREDIFKSWYRDQIGFIFYSVIHIIPFIAFTVVFLKSLFIDEQETRELDISRIIS